MSKGLPVTIYRTAQVRELDRLAIEQLGIPGYTLMYRAGEAAFRVLRKRWPRARRILVLCGAGNNAGDGYVLARIARSKGLLVTVAALVDPEKLSGDAAVAWETHRSAGGQTQEWHPSLLDRADVVVDAILGTGLARPLRDKPRELVEIVNRAGSDVLALDIPTGLNADNGQVMGAAIKASATITFVGLKLGLYTGESADHVGHILFDDLGIPASLSESLPIAARRIPSSIIKSVLPRRSRSAHKGSFGHVLIVGGDHGMAGAVRLAGEAALRSGAGRVSVATRSAHIQSIVAGCPELMCHAAESFSDLGELIERCDVVVVGPGIGTATWGQKLVTGIFATDKPLVVDADALNLLAAEPVRRGNWILTPHPGEASRLLGCSTKQVQLDRTLALGRLIDAFTGTVVLKGAGSLVGRSGDVAWVCDRGNPGMATAGMGDVLSGIMGAMVAQSGDLYNSALAAVYVHAAAGDDAARDGERGIIASDLIAKLGKWVNQN